jgi:hypothetical protein
MPHTFKKKIKSKLAEYAITVLGMARALVIARVFSIVNDVLSELSDTCPPPPQLKALTKKLDSIETVLSRVQKVIDRIEKLPLLLDAAILALQIYLDIQLHYRPDFVASPITSTTGTPTLAKKTTALTKLEERIRRAEERLEDLEEVKETIKIAVRTTKNSIAPVIAIVTIIQGLIDACYSKQDLTDEERRKIIDDVQKKTDDIYIKGITFISESGDTYTIKVLKDPDSPPISARRQAVAIDFRGVTVLTGPKSFASSPDILVEEIKFRLNQLKAGNIVTVEKSASSAVTDIQVKRSTETETPITPKQNNTTNSNNPSKTGNQSYRPNVSQGSASGITQSNLNDGSVNIDYEYNREQDRKNNESFY